MDHWTINHDTTTIVAKLLILLFAKKLTLFSDLKEPDKTLKGMLKYKSLPQHIEAIFIQNILKIFAYVMEQYEVNRQYDDILSLCDLISEKIYESLKSGELEVQERASTTWVILKIVQEEISASR